MEPLYLCMALATRALQPFLPDFPMMLGKAIHLLFEGLSSYINKSSVIGVSTVHLPAKKFGYHSVEQEER